MIHELNQKFSIDSASIILMNNFVNISQVSFPAVTIIYDYESYNGYFEDELVELSIF